MHLLHEGRWSLPKEEYGWECYVESHECANTIEVQNFFYRLGIQLFICYLTDTSDVHCGNLIANGEFPELSYTENGMTITYDGLDGVVKGISIIPS